MRSLTAVSFLENCFLTGKKRPELNGSFISGNIMISPKCPLALLSDQIINPHWLSDHPCVSPKAHNFPVTTHIAGLTSSVVAVGTTLPLAVVGTVPSQVATIFHLPHLNRCKFDSLLTTTYMGDLESKNHVLILNLSGWMGIEAKMNVD